MCPEPHTVIFFLFLLNVFVSMDVNLVSQDLKSHTDCSVCSFNTYVCFLQANDYTVEIDSVDGLEESLDSMGLTLLSTNRATDRFKSLTAST